MKKKLEILFSLALLLSISWQCSAKTIIYFDFKYNQKKLAETVCENRNKPKSCCAAKCQLEKEIKKEDKRQSNLPSAIKDKAEKSELKTGLISFVFVTAISILKTIFMYSSRLPENFPASVFHPPSL